eukprot:GHVP01021556.1.p1 GENE.GHVP01021556.1~~GHVP01021556.1.p1  ORF type:complete len:633 (-),score=80.90 GHVP01021556.1:34-1932(-)
MNLLTTRLYPFFNVFISKTPKGILLGSTDTDKYSFRSQNNIQNSMHTLISTQFIFSKNGELFENESPSHRRDPILSEKTEESKECSFCVLELEEGSDVIRKSKNDVIYPRSSGEVPHGIYCIHCKANIPDVSLRIFKYSDSNELIEHMKEKETPIKVVENIDLKEDGLNEPVIIRNSGTIRLDGVGFSLSDFLVLKWMTTMKDFNLSIEGKLFGVIEVPKDEHPLRSTVGSLNPCSSSKEYDISIKSFLFIVFSLSTENNTFSTDVIKMTTSLDFDVQSLQTIQSMRLGKFNSILLHKKAAYFLFKFVFSDEVLIDQLIIDTERSEIDPIELSEFDRISLCPIDSVRLINQAAYFLDKIGFSDSSNMDYFEINTKQSIIDPIKIHKMGSIDLCPVKFLRLNNNSAYFLFKMKFIAFSQTNIIEIDTNGTFIDPDQLSKMKNVNLNLVSLLHLRDDVAYSFLKMSFEKNGFISKIMIDTGTNRVDIQKLIKMENVSIGTVEQIQLNGHATYLVFKMEFKTESPITKLTISPDLMYICHKTIRRMRVVDLNHVINVHLDGYASRFLSRMRLPTKYTVKKLALNPDYPPSLEGLDIRKVPTSSIWKITLQNDTIDPSSIPLPPRITVCRHRELGY